ncbi:single-stranded-DNA-specific exonuclease RecJ [Enterococcus sp. 10A9_DIV0425]|uniref:Single-stranded-DNA-specific exonuclease RecJ n=1 Tax=Candidatus Enterococcus wittei TaxID=1987383 RepID=A0A2C9XP43_9ENTE|nr:single-stranded-DNA-specific exonuclease RecJ [Enterococcus sp. 10A9_DIV0425]OTP11963.1 single-stranded-DNA-specific exonuclease RecJ [Enterococcus sp. 10A9_DIV0425]
MRQANYDWKLNETEPSGSFLQMIEKKQLSPLIGQLLWQRGYQEEDSIQKFLNPKEQTLHDPYLMHDMDKAISRIQEAVINNEPILVYGDYDADGITSATVMKETLELLGAQVEVFLPNRFEHGYGPNRTVYQEKIDEGIQLIVTVDNGVAGHEAISYAQQRGVDVIVTDHHELPNELPPAYAIVHPRHPEGNYPFGELAGVGVAFKVATALLEEPPAEFLDLVAIGTIADLVSMTDENRTLVVLGLAAIRQSERIGLQALFDQSGVKIREVDETMIGFSIAPRLNAIGRMGDPNPAVELLATFDETRAKTLAEQLQLINEKRKATVEEITNEALAMINHENQIHVLAKEGWHEGVLGIVAGKIMNQTGKPTIVLGVKEGKIAKGSGRSIEALNLFEMLNEMRELFTFFGGHHAAVGLTMPAENIDRLQEQMNQYIEKNQIDLSKGPVLMIDEVVSPKDITVEGIESLRLLAPFGTDNPEPTFLFKQVTVENTRRIGTTQQHLKLSIIDEASQLDAVAFGFGAEENEFLTDDVNVIGKLSINEWNGRKKPQLLVTDFAVDGLQVFDWRAKRYRIMPEEVKEAVYVAFSEQSLKELNEEVQKQVILFEDLATFEERLHAQRIHSLVIVDCPEELNVLKEILSIGSFSRIYLLGISIDEAYLNGVGSREQYARLFKLIHAQEKIDIRHKLGAIAQYLKIPQKLLIFMIQVFFELKFVTIENGVLEKVATPESHPLTDSSHYQKRLKKIKVEEFLLLSDIPTIKKWLTT